MRTRAQTRNLGPAQRGVQGLSPEQERLSGAQVAALQLDSFPRGVLQLLALLSQQVPDPQPHHSALKQRARGGCAGNFAALGRGLGALGRPAPHCTHTSKPQPGSPGRATGSQQQLPGRRGSLNPFPAVEEASQESRGSGREESTLRPSIKMQHHSLLKKKTKQQNPKKSLGMQPSSSPSHGLVKRQGTIPSPGQKPSEQPAQPQAPHSPMSPPFTAPCPGPWSQQGPVGDPGTATAWQGLLCTPEKGNVESFHSHHLKSWC